MSTAQTTQAGPLTRALGHIASFVTGRKTRFVIFIAWVAIFSVSVRGCTSFQKVQRSAPTDYLPSSAEAVKADAAAFRFPAGRLSTAAVIYRRSSGLTAADRARISAERTSLRSIKNVGGVDAAQYSRDHTSALVIVRVPTRPPAGINTIKDIRALADHNTGGLTVAVTGPAALNADSSNIFKSLDSTLFLTTFLLVLVLLVLIYRSPFFWILPLIAIVLAAIVARGIGYLFAKQGLLTITGQAGGVMAVLVFGVGTDYSLLLVSRYRTALGRSQDSRAAAAEAVRQAGPAIVPSCLTVVAGLLCLELATNKGTFGLGAIGAAGVALAMVSILTLLPALLATFGKRLFWPFVPRPDSAGVEDTRWGRWAHQVARRPRRLWIGTFLVLGVMAIGLVDLNTSLTTGTEFRDKVESVTGQGLVAKAFPPGDSSPANVIVTDVSKASAVRTAVAADHAAVASVGALQTAHGAALFQVALAHDPYGEPGFKDITSIRKVAHQVAPQHALVGGDTAAQVDLRTTQSRDNLVIIPLVLIVVLVILGLLLRAVVAPFLLIATVVASFAATLGVASAAFAHIFHFAGLDPTMPLLSFVLLVSLGVDYNIFLMTRVREETFARGTRGGMIRGLAVTGGVITSAGIVLAGTFSMLALLSLVVLIEVGLTIAFGALLDTFVVRTLLVPSLVLDVGPRTWWPSALARER